MTQNVVIFNLFNENHFTNAICHALGYKAGICNIHDFPDQETLVTIESDVKNKSTIILANLDRPNNKIATLLFAAATLKDLGANNVGLITPYLPYMRQDKVFHPGEGITSKYFAKLISTYFDSLLTIDPHLHRWHALNDIYSIPSTSLHATYQVGNWILNHINKPLLIGPDKESEQWVAEIAAVSKSPYLIVEKTRTGDRNVTSTVPQLELYPDHTPVIVDDIISTGVTMIEAIKHIQNKGISSIYCVGVHAIFSNNAYQDLLQTGITDIVTCNTIPHPSNKIDLSHLIIDALRDQPRL